MVSDSGTMTKGYSKSINKNFILNILYILLNGVRLG